MFHDDSVTWWGCVEGAAKRACGKTVVQTPKNGQQQALNQKPAARLPRKDSHFLDQGHLRFQILCAGCLWTENELFGAHRRIAKTRPLWLGQGYQARKICVSAFSYLFGTEHTHSHEDMNGLLEIQRSDLRQRCREEPAIFLDNLSGQKMYSPKPGNGLSKTP